MFRRILIAIQHPDERRALAAAAAELAAAGETRALAVHVRPMGTRVEELDAAGRMVELAVSDLKREGLSAEGEVITVDAGREVGRAIADVASGWEADLVVVGSRRLSEFQAAWRGSVSHAVIRFAGCPVMVAPSIARPGAAVRSILLAVDSSRPAAAAERLVAQVAAEHGARVAVLHVPQPIVVSGPVLSGWYMPPPNLDSVRLEAVGRLQEQGVDAWQVEPAADGSIASVIAATADHEGVDLVVLGSRGLGDVAGLIRGSISHEVLHETPRAVLVARAETS